MEPNMNTDEIVLVNKIDDKRAWIVSDLDSSSVLHQNTSEISPEEHVARTLILPGIKATIDTIVGENSIYGTLDIFSINSSKLEAIYSNDSLGLVEMTNIINKLNNDEFTTCLTSDTYLKAHRLIIAVKNIKEIFNKNNNLV